MADPAPNAIRRLLSGNKVSSPEQNEQDIRKGEEEAKRQLAKKKGFKNINAQQQQVGPE